MNVNKMKYQTIALIILSLFVLLSITHSFAQNFNQPSQISPLLNMGAKNIAIAGYGDIEYVQQLDSDVRYNGKLDIHRMVLLFGYQFNKNLKFISEIEYEHVKEVFVEQAFLDYKVNKYITWRSGLILVPMGIVNERHESNTFNGVLRPSSDKYLVPTTWRELGTGFTGIDINTSIRYQLYVLNGFNGYDESAKFNGSNGLRSGRQKAAKSYMSSPTFTAKVEYFGYPNLVIGLASYMGKSQSTLYDNIQKNDMVALAKADSSTVGINMFGLDARYLKKGWTFRGQYIYTQLNNTEQYNSFGNTDLASKISGYYVEAAYNIFQQTKIKEQQLFAFVRYDQYNTHQKVEEKTNANEAYNRNDLTIGFTYKPTNLVAFKTDVQLKGNEASTENESFLNFGIGFAF